MPFPYIWGDALTVLERMQPDARICRKLGSRVQRHEDDTFRVVWTS
jgi:hypothetical protein